MLLLLVAPTLAGEDACFSCCRAGGLATCDAQLVAYGEGSRMVRESYGWRINGTWTVACDGRASFDPGDSRLVDHPPLGGELIQRPITPLQVRCFQEACSLPPGVEISKPDEDGNYFLMDAESGLAADADALKRAPKTAAAASGTVIMVDGRPLVVEPVAPGASSVPPASTTWAASEPAPPSPSYPSSSSSSSGATSWSSPTTSTPAYSPPPSSAPTYSAPASAPAATSAASAGPVTRWSRPADPEPGPSVVTTTSPSTSAPSPASPSPYLDPSSYPSWSPTPAPAQGSTPASGPAPTPSWSSPAPAPVATPTYEPPAPTYEPPPAPTYTPPTPTPAPAAPADLFTTLSASIPADPPAACKAPIEVVRAEARKRVDLGDEKRIQQDAAGAVQQYRAALSMDACNAYAWLGIGEIAAQSGRPDLAVRTLGNATRLLPGHYGAWTALGQQYEALHQDTMAAEAYSKALALRPGLQEALDGWRRTASPTP